jgi:Flp pilus assembly protein TadG
MIGKARCATGLGRRGTVAVMIALMMPALLGAGAMAIDVGVWYREAERLQLAADAGAEGAARLLAADTSGNSAYQAAALIEVNGVTGGTNIGTLQTPVTVSVTANWSQVTVTLYSTADSYLARALGFTGPAISATATVSAITSVPTACVLALSTSASPAIQVDNMGSIVASGCPIFSDSTATTNNGSIYLNSGTISGSSIATAGLFVKSNSGSNTVSPATPTSYASSESDPDAGLTMPSPSSTCNSKNNYTSYGTYALSATTWCGNVTIGGNGSTDSFSAGTYYIVNGNLTFTNANVSTGSIPSSGVTFVLTGTSPGTFTWTNNSTGTITAPGSGALAGILVWQTKPCATSACTSFSSCSASCSSATSCSSTNYFGGPGGYGGTLQASGTIYAPCGGVDFTNGGVLKPSSGGSLSVVSQAIYAAGSASSVSTSTSGSGSSSSTQLVLTQ